MLPLSTVGFSELVQRMAATVQGQISALVNFSPGSVLRALLEACAASVMWVQWLTVQVMTMTRAATSTGPNLDSWMANFSFQRLPAVAATGYVTFSRFSLGLTSLIPVGVQLKSADGSLIFLVVADAANSAWVPSGQYEIQSGVSSVTLPLVAQLAGSSGNVIAGIITVLSFPIPGVDTVVNALPFSGGVDAETDYSFRTRFTAYINSLSLATPLAISAAVNAIQQGLRLVVLENSDSFGNQIPGMFSVIVDDGSGDPPPSLISTVSSVVNSVRPIGVRFSVSGPIALGVSLAMTVNTSNPLTKGVIIGVIERQILAWVAALPISGMLAISKIDAIAHAVDPSVISCESVLLNGLNEDFSAPINGVILLSSITLS